LGYVVEFRELRACDYGTPTIRKRLFMITRRDGLPIQWPEPTNAAPTSPAVLAGKLAPWRTAAECIDWSIPCPSIFERKRPLADATMRRIAKGIMRYVVDAAQPFIVGQGGPIYSGKPVSADQPFGTMTTENHRAVVVPSIVPVTHRVRPQRIGARAVPAPSPAHSAARRRWPPRPWCRSATAGATVRRRARWMSRRRLAQWNEQGRAGDSIP
jgi:DNA (cytosine-5)-methyltransferase 1